MSVGAAHLAEDAFAPSFGISLDIDLAGAVLHVPVSKTEADIRPVHLEPELVALLREHKIAARWSQPDDFVFPGRYRNKPRERNSVRTRSLHNSVKRANKAFEENNQQPIPADITFHALRRTYAALRAELGEHPAITAAQMGHTDPRMTLRVYTDVATDTHGGTARGRQLDF
jgi:integrase